MDSRRNRIIVLVMVLLISFTIIFSPKKTADEITDSAAEIRVMNKKIKRNPASENSIVPDNRPVLGTNFRDNMSRRGAPPQSNSASGEEVGYIDDLLTEQNETRDAEREATAPNFPEYAENDDQYYNGGAFLEPQAAQQIPLAPSENDSRSPANSYPGGMRFSSVPPPLSGTPPPTTPVAETGSGGSVASPSISYVGIIDGQLIIRGTNLNSVNGMTLTGPLVNTGLEAITRTSSEIIAMSLNGVTLLAGTLYDLIISDANGSTTFPIDIVLADGSVAYSKLAPLPTGAGNDGDILVWRDATGWGNEPQTWQEATGGIHYSSGDVGIGTSVPNSLLELRGTHNGTADVLLKLSTTGSNISTDTGIQFLEGTTNRVAGIRAVNDGAGKGSLRFDTYDGGYSTDKVVILGNGNVGIGQVQILNWKFVISSEM